jgi:hypothetical protein
MATATATPPTCIILNENSICGRLYNGFPVVAASFASQSALDTFISQEVIDGTSVENAFVESFGCTSGPALTTAIASRRFHTSYQCSSIVDDAITRGCTFDTAKFPSSGPVLCNGNCQSAVSSLEAIFGDRAACPSASTAEQGFRDGLVDRFTSYCSSAATTASLQSGLCVSGASNDQRNCGFASRENSEIGCKALPGDECCASVIASLPQTKGNGTTSANTSGGSDGFIFSTAAIVAIVLGIAFFAILLIVILFVKRKHSNAETAGDRGSTDEYLKYESTSQERLSPYGAKVYEEAPFTNQLLPPLPPISNTSSSQDLYYSTNTKSFNSTPPPSKPLPTAIPRKEPIPPSRQPPAPADSKLMVAIHPYYPTLADELRLEVGDDVLLLKAFDGTFHFIFNTSRRVGPRSKCSHRSSRSTTSSLSWKCRRGRRK